MSTRVFQEFVNAIGNMLDSDIEEDLSEANLEKGKESQSDTKRKYSSSPARITLDKRIQGFNVHELSISRDLASPNSPFAGDADTRSADEIAKNISKVLWGELVKDWQKSRAVAGVFPWKQGYHEMSRNKQGGGWHGWQYASMGNNSFRYTFAEKEKMMLLTTGRGYYTGFEKLKQTVYGKLFKRINALPDTGIKDSYSAKEISDTKRYINPNWAWQQEQITLKYIAYWETVKEWKEKYPDLIILKDERIKTPSREGGEKFAEKNKDKQSNQISRLLTKAEVLFAAKPDTGKVPPEVITKFKDAVYKRFVSLRDSDECKAKPFLRYNGVQIGHVFGPAATQAAMLTGAHNLVALSGDVLSDPNEEVKSKVKAHQVVNQDFSSLQFDKAVIAGAKAAGVAPGTLDKILYNVREILKTDTDVTIEKTFGGKDGSFRLVITRLENSEDNMASGAAISGLITEIRNLLNEVNTKVGGKKWSENAGIAAALAGMPGSDSFIDIVDFQITESFQGRKRKNVKILNKGKTSSKATVNTTYHSSPLVTGASANKSTARRKVADKRLVEKSTPDASDRDIVELINAKLHDQIKKNMGKGGARNTLNYRTGRFAHSAKVMKFMENKSGKTASAVVKYQINPYGTFEPGGKLYSPGRNPQGIFARSIRQILQEEQLESYTRVMVKTHG